MRNRYPILGVLLALMSTSGITLSADPLQPIDALDVPRYMGRWFEIAKYPNWFQLHCVANTSAEYRLLPDGTVEVINQCKRKDGSKEQAIGSARQIGKPTSPKLEVRFAPQWTSFLPFVWGDYWVIDLDADYQLAAVSEPLREHLWVLSRTPEVDPVAYESLLHRLREKGFDMTKLELTPQEK